MKPKKVVAICDVCEKPLSKAERATVEVRTRSTEKSSYTYEQMKAAVYRSQTHETFDYCADCYAVKFGAWQRICREKRPLVIVDRADYEKDQEDLRSYRRVPQTMEELDARLDKILETDGLGPVIGSKKEDLKESVLKRHLSDHVEAHKDAMAKADGRCICDDEDRRCPVHTADNDKIHVCPSATEICNPDPKADDCGDHPDCGAQGCY